MVRDAVHKSSKVALLALVPLSSKVCITALVFWADEMTTPTADPGQDPRGAPDPGPMWTLLDTTPEGRGGDWYPSLTYPA